MTAGLDYQLTPETLLYVKGSRGYKSGGFNLSRPKQSAFSEFKPEYVTDVELGVKSDWEIMGIKARTRPGSVPRRLQQHPTFGHTAYQRAKLSPVTENAAAATIQGVEAQGSVIPVSGTEISLAYSFIAAKYNTFTDPLAGNMSGLEFPFVPKNKVSVTARQELPIPANGRFEPVATYSVQSHVRGDNTFSPTGVIQAMGS